MLHFALSGSVLRKTSKNLFCSYSNALPSIRIDEKIIHLNQFVKFWTFIDKARIASLLCFSYG